MAFPAVSFPLGSSCTSFWAISSKVMSKSLALLGTVVASGEWCVSSPGLVLLSDQTKDIDITNTGSSGAGLTVEGAVSEFSSRILGLPVVLCSPRAVSLCALGGSGVCFGDDVVVLARQGPCCSMRRPVLMCSLHSALVARNLLFSSGDHL